MNRFEAELKNDNFVCSECLKCKKLVWPPSDYCNRCFDKVAWRSVSREATLLEYGSRNGEGFCLAELEGEIRIIGSIQKGGGLKIGQGLVLEKCDYDGEEKYFFRVKDSDSAP